MTHLSFQDHKHTYLVANERDETVGLGFLTAQREGLLSGDRINLLALLADRVAATWPCERIVGIYEPKDESQPDSPF